MKRKDGCKEGAREREREGESEGGREERIPVLSHDDVRNSTANDKSRVVGRIEGV
jgi:hypothetical protein